MLSYFGATERGVPVLPIHVPAVRVPNAAELRGQLLDELDRALSDYGAAFSLLVEARGRCVVAGERVTLSRAALAG